MLECEARERKQDYLGAGVESPGEDHPVETVPSTWDGIITNIVISGSHPIASYQITSHHKPVKRDIQCLKIFQDTERLWTNESAGLFELDQ